MTMNANAQKLLDQLVSKLQQKEVADGNLQAVVLYGSAVSGDYHKEFSDLNVLCVLDRLDTPALEKLGPVVAWWQQQKQPPLMLFTLDELRRSADVFAIELYDIKSRHRVLFGQDYFTSLEVPMNLHRVQVERELRTSLIKLRQRYLASQNDAKSVLRLMTDSVSTFCTLFHHSLIAMGEPPPAQKRQIIERLASKLGFDRKAFDAILDLREGKTSAQQINHSTIFAGYLDTVVHVIDEVDRRLG